MVTSTPTERKHAESELHANEKNVNEGGSVTGSVHLLETQALKEWAGPLISICKNAMGPESEVKWEWERKRSRKWKGSTESHSASRDEVWMCESGCREKGKVPTASNTNGFVETVYRYQFKITVCTYVRKYTLEAQE